MGMKGAKPLSWDRIVVKRIREREIDLGAVMPGVNKERPQQGDIVAVKRGNWLEHSSVATLDVKVGDRVVFGKYSGTEHKLCGTRFLSIRADDVLGFVDAEAAPSTQTARIPFSA
jgi:chaperonin GroES